MQHKGQYCIIQEDSNSPSCIIPDYSSMAATQLHTNGVATWTADRDCFVLGKFSVSSNNTVLFKINGKDFCRLICDTINTIGLQFTPILFLKAGDVITMQAQYTTGLESDSGIYTFNIRKTFIEPTSVTVPTYASLAPPNYSSQQTLTTTNNATVTITSDGYVKLVSAFQNPLMFAENDLFINDVSVGYSVQYTNSGTFTIQSSILPVKQGDLVRGVSNTDGLITSHTLYFYSPSYIEPKYLSQAPLLNYSSLEQDTGRVFMNGKRIFVKTLEIVIPTMAADIYMPIGNVDDLIPGATGIINNIITRKERNSSYGYFDAEIDLSNRVMLRRATPFLADTVCYVTLEYVK